MALSRRAIQRWRQAAVVVCTAVACLAFLSAASVIHLARHSDETMESRSPVWAQTPGDAAILISLRGIVVPRMGQVPIVWLQPTEKHVLPPGLTEVPAPGTAVLSPGLVAAGYSAEDFGLRTPAVGHQRVITSMGLLSLSEGFVYARPGPARDLGEGGALLPVAGWEGGAPRAAMETVPDVPSGSFGVAGALVFLGIPAAFVLVGGARSGRELVRSRSQVLHRLGVSQVRLTLLAALETAVLAVPGALVGWFVWFVVVRPATRVPLTDVRLLPGSFQLPAMVALAISVVTGAVAAMVGSAGTVRPTGPRRWMDRRIEAIVAGLGIVLWLGAMALLIVGPSLDQGGTGRTTLFVGGVLTLIALPPAVAGLTRFVGRTLERSSRPSAWLAGRRLRGRATLLSRSAAIIGMATFICGAATALVMGMQADDISPVAAPRNVYLASWRSAKPSDFGDLARSVAPIGSAVVVGQEADGRSRVTFGSCDEALSFFGLSAAECDVDHPQVVPETLRGHFEAFGLVVVTGSPSSGDLDNPQVLISAPRGTSDLEVVSRTHGLPAFNLRLLEGRSDFVVPIAAWLNPALFAAVGLFAAGFLRQLGDRVRSVQRESMRLSSLGLDNAEIRVADLISVACPMLVSIPMGFLGAMLFALRGTSLGVTKFNVGVLTSATALMLVASVLTMVIFVWAPSRDAPS